MFPNPIIGNYEFAWFSIVKWGGIGILILFTLWVNKKDRKIIVDRFSLLIVPLYIILFAYIGFLGASFLAYFEIRFLPGNDLLFYQFSMDHVLSGFYGFSWYGGFLILGLIVGTIAVFIIKDKSYKVIFLNYHAMITSLAYALGRQACFVSADGCYGIPTNHPFGMRFMYGEKPTILPVHPTPLYESIAHLFIFILLFRMRKSNTLIPSAIFLILTGVSRFLVEFIRRNPEMLFGLTLAQLISIFIIGTGLILFLISNKLTKINNYEKN